MKQIRITPPEGKVTGCLTLPSSKSLSARALLLQALCPDGDKGTLTHLADCDDTRVLADALSRTYDHTPTTIDIGGAGTAMRFLTAYYACHPDCDVLLTGNARMQQRPIGPLVDALGWMGADITCVGMPGCPPLLIRGRSLYARTITIDSSLSSQYVSALLMIAPVLNSQGVTIRMEGHVASRPYIDMTLALMQRYGVRAGWETADTLVVQPGSYVPCDLAIEGDWSAASYWLALQAVARCRQGNCDIHLEGLTADSLQGDSRCASLLDAQQLMRGSQQTDCADTPDLIPTLAVAYCLAGCPFRITGAESLRVKETDRIAALVNELGTLGYPLAVEETNDGGHLSTALVWDGTHDAPHIDPACGAPVIHTYDDHRMAMAFMPAALVFGHIIIDDPDVVSKSYPAFWDDLRSLGFNLVTIKK